MNEFEYNSKCKLILEKYGYEYQLKIKLVEELAELIVAIQKKDTDNIIEEIADVKVLFDQILITHPEWDILIASMKENKIERQLKRIGV